MRYRKMESADFEGIAKLAEDIDGVRFAESEDASWHNVFLNQNTGMCFVAEQDGLIMGFVYCGCDGRRAIVYHLAVRSSARNRGVGKSLMRLVEDAIIAAGISRGLLLVISSNEGAIDFYSKMGWRFREDLRVMSKDMPSRSVSPGGVAPRSHER